MKNIFIIIILFIALSFGQYWKNISPFPNSNIGISGNFISESEGWIEQISSLADQSIYHTIDGGKSWDKIFTLEEQDGNIVFLNMVDSVNGWMKKVIAGTKDYYLRTQDGGYIWEDMTDYMPIKDVFYPIYFVSMDMGFHSVGTDSLDLSAMIYKTTDGGNSWYLTNTPTIMLDERISPCGAFKFFFLDENYGWAACFGDYDIGLSIYTTDGGENWLPGLPPVHQDIFDIHFINPNCGGAVGYSPPLFSTEVMITEDNFNSIKHYYTMYDWNQYARAICFQNDTTIWVTGQPGIMNRSIDGGETFEEYQTIDADFNKIQFFGNIGYVFGSNNNALYRFDGDSGIDPDQSGTIDNYELQQNYPNPFNNQTNISYNLQNNSEVKINIYNTKGEFVQNLVNDKQRKGMHSIIFEANKFNSGIYYYRLKVDGVVKETKKMLYLR